LAHILLYFWETEEDTMKYLTTLKRSPLLISALLTLFLATGCSENSADGEYLSSSGDSDSDGDGDMDSDSDGDMDGDTDMDSDTDGDSTIIEDPEEWDTDTDSCDTVNEVVLYLSADDSNSMASPVQARATILSGIVFGNLVRTYEFLNYYTFDNAPALAGTVAVTAQMTPNLEIGSDETYDFQIAVQAPALSNAARRPVNLTLSLDTSGSMGGHPIEMVRQSCLAIAGSLKNGDIVSAVTWNTSPSILLNSHNISAPDDATLVSVCNGITSSGGTNLSAGLVTAYNLAEANFSENRINRVVLMSDGFANVGVTDKDLIALHAYDANGEGIYMIGVGMGNAGSFNDDLMDTITDEGKGAYIFIDTAAEAQLMFGPRFVSNIEVAARDVQVELTLPATFEMIEFHGEEYSENPDEVDPQHLAPNDAMIYHQIIGSCDSTVVDHTDPVIITATYYNPISLTPLSTTLNTTMGTLLAADDTLILKGNAIVAYAEALKELKTLTGSDATDLIDSVIVKVQTAQTASPGDPDLAEVLNLLLTYRAIF
jgi:Ca-activated chloride channel family protein